MWYEILPCFGIMVGIMSVATMGMAWVPQIAYGKPYYRIKTSQSNTLEFWRDQRVSGNPYITQGLEAIPDEKE